jgi:Co/Zn/Cd efflux system component
MSAYPSPTTRPLPIVPQEVLQRFRVNERHDSTRLKVCARLLQAIYLIQQQIPTGHHRGRNGEQRRLGSRLSQLAAMAGRNFLTPDIARLAHHVLAYREPGAFLDRDRLLGNALSSTGLCLNLFGSIAQDPDLAANVLRQMLPDQDIDTVTAIRFEHSPGRDDATLTGDRSAHDCCIWFTRKAGSRDSQQVGVLCIEMKYTEDLHDSAPIEPGRYDDLADASGLFKEPHSAVLRVNPLQQLFREHLLAQAAVMRGDWPSAIFVSVAPAVHDRAQRQADLYSAFLNPTLDGQVPYRHLTLDAWIDAIGQAGATDAAAALFDRYLDWRKVDVLVGAAVQSCVAKWKAPKTKSPLPLEIAQQAA